MSLTGFIWFFHHWRLFQHHTHDYERHWHSIPHSLFLETKLWHLSPKGATFEAPYTQIQARRESFSPSKLVSLSTMARFLFQSFFSLSFLPHYSLQLSETREGNSLLGLDTRTCLLSKRLPLIRSISIKERLTSMTLSHCCARKEKNVAKKCLIWGKKYWYQCSKITI